MLEIGHVLLIALVHETAEYTLRLRRDIVLRVGRQRARPTVAIGPTIAAAAAAAVAAEEAQNGRLAVTVATVNVLSMILGRVLASHGSRGGGGRVYYDATGRMRSFQPPGNWDSGWTRCAAPVVRQRRSADGR